MKRRDVIRKAKTKAKKSKSDSLAAALLFIVRRKILQMRYTAIAFSLLTLLL